MKDIIDIIFTMIVTTMIFMLMTYTHELAHVNAYEYKGYRNNTVQWTNNHIGGLSVQNHDDVTPEDKREIYQANMMVDAVGYNVGVPLTFIIMVLILMYLGGRKDAKRNRD